jgi:hypothetical protein
MSRLLPPVVLVLVALALAGCGGNGDADGVPMGTEAPAEGEAGYVQEVRAADGTIRGASDRLSAGTTTAELEEVAADLEEAVRRVEQATPPYDLLPEHQRLTQALWEAVDEAHGVAAEGTDEVAAGNLAPVVDALREADEAIAGMEEKGHDVRRRT